MANGFFGAPRGETESTTHGRENDVIVPNLQAWHCIKWDEIRITAAMLIMVIMATRLHEWALPIFGGCVVVAVLYQYIEQVENANELLAVLGKILLTALIAFGILSLFRGRIALQLQDGLEALWKWPPNVAYFINRWCVILLPFLIPFFTNIPIIQRRLRVAILDPSFPSPRKQVEIEGMQDPYHYTDNRETSPAIYPITVGWRKDSQGKPTAQVRRDLFAPKVDRDGLAKYAVAVLGGTATISEKGTRKGSKNPKVGATQFGYTQDEYTELKEIMTTLGLIEPKGNGVELTANGYEVFTKIIIDTLGECALPHPENVLDE